MIILYITIINAFEITSETNDSQTRVWTNYLVCFATHTYSLSRGSKRDILGTSRVIIEFYIQTTSILLLYLGST